MWIFDLDVEACASVLCLEVLAGGIVNVFVDRQSGECRWEVTQYA